MKRALILCLLLAAAFAGCGPAAAPPAHRYGGVAVAPSLLSANVVYASKTGIVADGSTDQTAAIQTVLDRYGSAGTPLDYSLDTTGTVLVKGTIYLWANQTFRGLPGVVLKKAGNTQGTNGWAVISNKHPVTYPTAPTDTHIRICDLYIDGNGRNYSSGNPSDPPDNTSGWTCIAIGLYGVSYFSVERVQVHDPAAYGFHLASCSHGSIVDCSKTAVPGNTNYGDSGFQLNGGCSDIRVTRFYGQANDDGIPLCASSETTDTEGAAYKPGTVPQAPISGITVTDSTFDRPTANYQGNFGRFLSADAANCPITHIKISRCRGGGGFRALVFDNFNLSGDPGWYDDILIEGCTVALDTSSAAQGPAPGLVYFATAAAGRVSIRDCLAVANSAVTIPGIVTVASTASVGTLSIDGLHFEDRSGLASSAPVVGLAGTVTTAIVAGLTTDRGTQAILAQPAISCTGTIDRLQVIGGHVDRYANVVNVSAGTTSVVNAVGVSHTNAGGGTSFTHTTPGVLTTLNAAAVDAANVGP